MFVMVKSSSSIDDLIDQLVVFLSEKSEANDEIQHEDIRIGLPNDRTNLENGWKDITDDKGSIEFLGIKENSILAYTTDNSNQFIVESAKFDYELEEERN